MFVRVSNFGIASREAFPEESGPGRKFAQLAAIVASIEQQLVKRTMARAEARKVKSDTRKTALEFIKALASTGRRAAADETGPHPFHLPKQRSATVVLASARLFLEEAERRKEKFVELGMPPTFLTDYGKVVDDLARAVNAQRESGPARRKALAAIEAALQRGSKIIADLDVSVLNTLRADPARLAEWAGARHMDHGSSSSGTKPVVPETDAVVPPVAIAPAADGPAAVRGEEVPPIAA
jgi:hypothetical protein